MSLISAAGRAEGRQLASPSWVALALGGLVFGSCLVMVGGAVAHPAATPEPDVRLSPHPAPQQTGRCQRNREPCAWS